MLGDRQWHWLAQELAHPADIRLIISSVQVVADGHGFERWGNLPLEKERLLKALSQAAPSGICCYREIATQAHFIRPSLCVPMARDPPFSN